MIYICHACGWRPQIGKFMEVDFTPKELARMGPSDLSAMAEAEHFLESDCRGRVEAFHDELYRYGGPLISAERDRR